MLQWRIQSPFGGSILMISAPMSPRIWVANGPCANWVKSATTSPVSGPVIGETSVHCGQTGPRSAIEQGRQQAAIDPVATAGRKRRFVARQIEDEIGDFVRPADAAERMEPPPFLDRRFRIVPAERVGGV